MLLLPEEYGSVCPDLSRKRLVSDSTSCSRTCARPESSGRYLANLGSGNVTMTPVRIARVERNNARDGFGLPHTQVAYYLRNWCQRSQGQLEKRLCRVDCACMHDQRWTWPLRNITVLCYTWPRSLSLLRGAQAIPPAVTKMELFEMGGNADVRKTFAIFSVANEGDRLQAWSAFAGPSCGVLSGAPLGISSANNCMDITGNAREVNSACATINKFVVMQMFSKMARTITVTILQF